MLKKCALVLSSKFKQIHKVLHDSPNKEQALQIALDLLKIQAKHQKIDQFLQKSQAPSQISDFKKPFVERKILERRQ